MAFWNKKIINLENKYFGLDISDLSVKIFQLEKNGREDVVRSFGVKEIPLGCIENGKIINRKKSIRKKSSVLCQNQKFFCTLSQFQK